MRRILWVESKFDLISDFISNWGMCEEGIRKQFSIDEIGCSYLEEATG